MPTNAQREEVNIGAWAAFGASLLLYHARLFWNIYRTRRRRGRPAHEHDTFFATASSLPYMMVINPAWISKMAKQSYVAQACRWAGGQVHRWAGALAYGASMRRVDGIGFSRSSCYG
ncbi:hypothetical protein EON67_11180 [archaeon]|nr:MAG: hypothetical protein EON67_11180 [archaeon]